MAYDLLFKNSNRNWSRDAVSGEASCSDSSRSLVPQEHRESATRESATRGPGVLGYSIAIMIGSRLITGKWPWYWFRRVDQRLG